MYVVFMTSNNENEYLMLILTISAKCDSPSKSYEVNGVNVHFENTVQFISNGKLNQPYTKSTTFDKTSSNRNATKKIPFIIHAQANGTSARSVVINPSFGIYNPLEIE